MLPTMVYLNALVVAGVLAIGTHAQQAPTVAGRLGPFLDQQTFAILRVDVRTFDPQPWLDYLTELIPGSEREVSDFGRAMQSFRAQLRNHGVNELYAVFSLGDYPSLHPYYVIPGLPADSVEDVRKLLAVRPQVWQVWSHDGTTVIAPLTVIGRIRRFQPPPRAELWEAFGAVPGCPLQIVVSLPPYARKVIDELMPEFPQEFGGGASKTLARGFRWAAFGFYAAPQRRIRLVIQVADEEAATVISRQWKQAVAAYLSRAEVARRVPNPAQAAELLTPKVNGSQLLLDLREQDGSLRALVTAVSVPIEAAIERARRAESANNLKQLALAMHNYHAHHKTFPPVGSQDAQGRPLLSWRVHLLPYLGYSELYRQFRLDEPWDSPHNRKLIPKMPEVFRCPASRLPTSSGMATYRVVSGDETVFPPGKPISLRDILDGTTTTILLVEVDDAHAVPWTKPEGLPFDPQHPARGLGGQFKGGFHVAFCDGSVRFLVETIDPRVLRALFTRDGREIVRLDRDLSPRSR